MDKQIVELLDGVIGVVVPEDANNFEVYDNNVIGGKCLMYLRGNPDYACEYSTNFPEGQWQILGLGNQLTEEQWEGVVDSKMEGRELWKSYETSYTAFHNATESGLSLLKSKGLKPQNTLILKRKA